jgi:flagellar hook-associated protein 3 FlgL
LQTKQEDMMALTSIVGGRTNRVAIVRERYSLDDLNYTTRISKIEDADMAEAISNLKTAESVYNAALGAGARVIQPSLLDFLS